MLADDIGFTTDEERVAERARQTPAKVEQLLSTSHSVIAQFNLLVSAQFALGVPDESDLPLGDVEAARDIGFEPACTMQWGHWPLPIMRTHTWIGPEGFVKIDVYRGKSRYLNTYFDDGMAIVTKPSNSDGSNARTIYIDSSGHLREDYRQHLEAVKEYCDTHSARPLYRPTPDLIVECWRVYAYLHTTPIQALTVIMFNWGILITVGVITVDFFS